MSAPVIWLGIPAVAAVLLWAIRSERWTAILGGSLALILSIVGGCHPDRSSNTDWEPFHQNPIDI